MIVGEQPVIPIREMTIPPENRGIMKPAFFIVMLVICPWLLPGTVSGQPVMPGSVCLSTVTDAGGREVLPGRYEQARIVHDSEIIVIDGAQYSDSGCGGSPQYSGGVYGLYSVDGSRLLEPGYQSIDVLGNRLYRVNRGGECNEFGCRGGVWALYDATTRRLSSFGFSGIHSLPGVEDAWVVATSCPCEFEHESECSGKTCRFGLVKRDGSLILPMEYERISRTPDKAFFLVQKQGKTGVVNRDGSFVLPAVNDHVEYLGERLLGVYASGAGGVYDGSGKPLTGHVFGFLRLLAGQGILANRGGRCTRDNCQGGTWEFLDLRMKRIAGPFGQVWFHDQSRVVIAGDRGSVHLRHVSGKTVPRATLADARFQWSSHRSEPVVHGRTAAGMTVLFDAEGRILYRGKFADVQPVHRLHVFRERNFSGLVDAGGRIVLPAVYSQIRPRGVHGFDIQVAGLWGHADAGGRVILLPRCSRLWEAGSLLVCVKEGGKRGSGGETRREISLHDARGKHINQKPYDEFDWRSGGASIAWQGKRRIRVDDTGKEAFFVEVDRMFCDPDEKICIFEDQETKGALDFDGVTIATGDYSDVSIMDGVVRVVQGGRCLYGECRGGTTRFFDRTGKEVASPESRKSQDGKFSVRRSCRSLCRKNQPLWVTMDKNGKTLSKAYPYISPFVEGYARVAVDPVTRFFGRPGYPEVASFGVIDEQGKEILPLKYSAASTLEDGHFRVYEGGICHGMGSACQGGVWKILDEKGKEKARLGDVQPIGNVAGGSFAAFLESRDGTESKWLMDVGGKVLYTFKNVRFTYRYWFDEPFKGFFHEDSGDEGTWWVNHRGQPVGTPDAELSLLGKDRQAVLLERGKDQRVRMLSPDGRVLLDAFCRKTLVTSDRLICEETRNGNSTGWIRYYDTTGSLRCTMAGFAGPGRVLPRCESGATGSRQAGKGETAFHLETVERDHVIVRNANGRFASLDGNGRWISLFGRSWLVPAGVPNVYLFDAAILKGRRQNEVLYGLKEHSGRDLGTGRFRRFGSFTGRIAAAAMEQPGGKVMDVLVNTEGKVIFSDRAEVVHIGRDTAILQLEETAQSGMQTELIVVDYGGKILRRLPDASVWASRRNWTKRDESEVPVAEDMHFVFRQSGRCEVHFGMRVCLEENHGLMDAAGRVVMPPEYAALVYVGNRLVAGRKRSDCKKPSCHDIPMRLMDLKGKRVHPGMFFDVHPMENDRVFRAMTCRP